MKTLFSLFLVAALVTAASICKGDTINWTDDWSIPQAGTATGTLLQNGTLVDVVYTGHIYSIAPSSYWSEGSPAPYTGNSVVDNAPVSGITLSAANTAAPLYANILSFSAPVRNPLMALYSVGRFGMGVPYEFDQSFSLLSEGWGAWGDGSFTVSGDTITGYEGHGVIQFSGLVSAISWNNPVAEHHHGFAIGVQAVPVPGAGWLFGSWLLGLAGFKRFFRQFFSGGWS